MESCTEIDRRTCKRVVPMRVLVLGLSRTGTESMRIALKLLDFNDVYHGYAAAFENPKDCEMWSEALKAKYEGIGKKYGRQEFDQLLGHCQAVTDVPAAIFAEELILAYPDAKVILTLRDVDKWHYSVKTALLANMHSRRARVTQFLAWVFRSSNKGTRPVFLKAFKGLYGDSFEQDGRRIFQQHYSKVRSLVPPERLLEYRVEEGWEPLCRFLEVPTPKSSFPRGNDKTETTRRIRGLVQFELRKAVMSLCVLLGWMALLVGFIKLLIDH